jgi:glucokinase
MMNYYTVGVDIGGTNTSYAFFDMKGGCLYGGSFPTRATENAYQFSARLADEIRLINTQKFSQHSLAGISIAAPSVNNILGTLVNPSNLDWGTVNIISIMKEYFNVPMVIVNDANAAALGELRYGAAKEMKNFITVTLGTGLGGGIVLDGNLVTGKYGFAGEFGHMIVEANGRKCNCGRAGCLETYVSVNGMRRTVFHLISENNTESRLQNISFSGLSGEMISEFAEEGDPIAVEAFKFTGKILGRALANLTACFACEAIILFGGLSESGDLLLKPTREYFEEQVLEIHKGKVQIIKSELKNGMAAIMGANSLLRSELENKQSDDSKNEFHITI